MKKGVRYPFTKNGWRRAYDDARKAANLPWLRFHDLRHTAGTRVTRALGLKAAKDLLGHDAIQTTIRYAKSDVKDLRAALDGMAQRRHSVIDNGPQQLEKSGK